MKELLDSIEAKNREIDICSLLRNMECSECENHVGCFLWSELSELTREKCEK